MPKSSAKIVFCPQRCIESVSSTRLTGLLQSALLCFGPGNSCSSGLAPEATNTAKNCDEVFRDTNDDQTPVA